MKMNTIQEDPNSHKRKLKDVLESDSGTDSD
jgi:hypothetical protein